MTDHRNLPGSPVIILMGVTGSGKTTIGEMLAKRMEIPFHDADDFHTAESRKKLAADVPLDDEDREPWLQRLVLHIEQWCKYQGAILACSALKHKYRSRFRRAASNVRFVFLDGDTEVIAARLRVRAAQGDHVIKDFSEILRGQYRDLEVPSDALRVNIEQSPQKIVDDIVTALVAAGIKWKAE